MGLTQTVAPTQEPIELCDVKEFLRIDHTAEDVLIDQLINTATAMAQQKTNRQFVTATYALTLDRFYDVMRLPRPPVSTVTSITYLDTVGDGQTLDTSIYTLVNDRPVPRVQLAYNKTWPSTQDTTNAVTITYTAGYGDPVDVPEVIKSAIRAMTVDLYENRANQQEITLFRNRTVEALLWPYRVNMFA